MNVENIRSIEDLRALVGTGVRPKYLHFWGHVPKVPGRLDESCLSNWFPARFDVDGIGYPTTEHFMMAEKARLFGDLATREEILASASPGAAKSLGRKVAGFDEQTWIANRFGIVVRGNLAKFSQHADMGDLLRRTGTKVLVEASPRDRIWGIGMGKGHEDAGDPMRWQGMNLLGFALMEVRSRLA